MAAVEATVAPLQTFGSSDFAPSAFDFENTMSPDQMFQGTPSIADSDEQDEKPSKKRRSWGQQLPTPTTNLPPRKRAKTEAEKEQRRIERVIRNRLAAHSSRERKRKEVEQLEDQKSTIEAENDNMKAQLIKLTMRNQQLIQQVKELQAELGRPIDVKLEEPESPRRPLSPPYQPGEQGYETSSDTPATLAISTDMTQHPAEML